MPQTDQHVSVQSLSTIFILVHLPFETDITAGIETFEESMKITVRLLSEHSARHVCEWDFCY